MNNNKICVLEPGTERKQTTVEKVRRRGIQKMDVNDKRERHYFALLRTRHSAFLMLDLEDDIRFRSNKSNRIQVS